ncbi:hypothetical protein KQX54_020921 [Cotesia glomerata]|uniref:Uncharacterized protein n=1 Tax=Cotesia glomerata TaxID=32391 RepID=A0AAV7II50_COTGL|nr:hypothetical protein KQX54_020921 [Cotesia glomerata]
MRHQTSSVRLGWYLPDNYPPVSETWNCCVSLANGKLKCREILIWTCPAGHAMERGGWNGPRKHREGGNTAEERPGNNVASWICCVRRQTKIDSGCYV